MPLDTSPSSRWKHSLRSAGLELLRVFRLELFIAGLALSCTIAGALGYGLIKLMGFFHGA